MEDGALEQACNEGVGTGLGNLGDRREVLRVEGATQEAACEGCSSLLFAQLVQAGAPGRAQRSERQGEPLLHGLDGAVLQAAAEQLQGEGVAVEL